MKQELKKSFGTPCPIYVGYACVGGYCPLDLYYEYPERFSKKPRCSHCFYNNGCSDCYFSNEGVCTLADNNCN